MRQGLYDLDRHMLGPRSGPLMQARAVVPGDATRPARSDENATGHDPGHDRSRAADAERRPHTWFYGRVLADTSVPFASAVRPSPGAAVAKRDGTRAVSRADLFCFGRYV